MKQKPLRTVQKTFKVLENLAKKQPAKPSELLKESGLSRASIHRILSTLIELGYVDKESDSRYSLSFKMFTIVNTLRSSNRLLFIARSHMTRLSQISEEIVNLAITHDQRVLYIDKIESQHYLRVDRPIGQTDPLHCTALGKVLLSGLSDLEFEVFLKSTALVPHTKNTITNPEVLAGVIRNVKRQGYAVDLEELSLGIHCISAPVFDHANKVIAAISISGPHVRLTPERIEALKAQLIMNAAEVSKKLGCTTYFPALDSGHFYKESDKKGGD
jgi:DNA-binding IclR family transcriptional regulator